MVAAEQYTSPTPIQAQAIPHVLAGRDLLGIAQTGTGKTAAFALPILQRLAATSGRPARRTCRALVLAPTRELASQINESFRVYGRGLKLSSTVVFGGVTAGPQIRALGAGVDIVVATPGRLLDHLDQGNIRLDQIEILVLDEVDRMLDMGFILPVRRVVRASPAARQTLVFSATMPSDIRKLAAELLRDPVEVAVTPVASTVELIEQRVIQVDTRNKPELLAELLADRSITRALVFTRTKRGADRVTRHLETAGVGAAAIHGNKSQGQREQALAAFRTGRTRVLVATDIAARGIDVDGVSHVINFELPNVPESYVHRIGRTARAGASGKAISFCDAEERQHLRGIEALIRQRLFVEDRRGSLGGFARTNVAAAAPVPAYQERERERQRPRVNNRPKPAGRASAEPASHSAKAPAAKAPRSNAPSIRGREPVADLSNVRFMAAQKAPGREGVRDPGRDAVRAGQNRRPRRAAAR